MYQLHIANRATSSWSLRPWLVMRELDIAFQQIVTPFCETGDSHERFRGFSPSGRVPCLIDSHGEDGGSHDEPMRVWESLSIVEYLAERHPGVWPQDPSRRAWARSVCAEMHAGFASLRTLCPMHCALRVRLHEVPAPLAADTARLEALFGEGLSRFGGPYLCGERFTAADAFFAPVAFRFETYGLSLNRPARDYVDRLLALDAMNEWRQAAIAEPWREAEVEAAIRKRAEVIKDFRVDS